MEVGETVTITCSLGAVHLMLRCCRNSSERNKIAINLPSRARDIDYGHLDKKIKKEKKADTHNPQQPRGGMRITGWKPHGLSLKLSSRFSPQKQCSANLWRMEKQARQGKAGPL